MPVHLDNEGRTKSREIRPMRPSAQALVEIGGAVYDFMRAMDRLMRSLGVPTAFSYAEREPLRVRTVERICPGCGEVTITDEALAASTRFCGYCGHALEEADAETADR